MARDKKMYFRQEAMNCHIRIWVELKQRHHACLHILSTDPWQLKSNEGKRKTLQKSLWLLQGFVNCNTLKYFVAPTGIEPVFHAWEACVLAARRKRHSIELRGSWGIRTPGTVIPYVSLANWWFQPLTQTSFSSIFLKCGAKVMDILITPKFLRFFLCQILLFLLKWGWWSPCRALGKVWMTWALEKKHYTGFAEW